MTADYTYYFSLCALGVIQFCSILWEGLHLVYPSHLLLPMWLVDVASQ